MSVGDRQRAGGKYTGRYASRPEGERVSQNRGRIGQQEDRLAPDPCRGGIFCHALLSARVENTLDEMALAEQDDFQKPGDVYRWKKHYRFRIR